MLSLLIDALQGAMRAIRSDDAISMELFRTPVPFTVFAEPGEPAVLKMMLSQNS